MFIKETQGHVILMKWYTCVYRMHKTNTELTKKERSSYTSAHTWTDIKVIEHTRR
jgi:hypothetical protein